MTSILSRLDLRPIVPRDKRERHRVASTLELFFDLVFVVAVSLAAQNLHHLETEKHVLVGVGAFLMVFFAIWWAWMNFTWFATAFDNDDWLYRVTTITQMAGVLVLAAGIPGAMDHGDYAAVTYGYVIMRLAMVTQWLRLAVNSPEYRSVALRYAAGIGVVQLAWVLRLLLPESLGVISFILLAVAEVCVPVWAEHRQTTPYHNHHIAERFGLFTLVVLGEGLLGSANAIIDSLKDTEHIVPLVVLAGCSLVIVAAMWWLYFATPLHERFGTLRQSLTLGYAHYVIFAAAAAMSAGIEVLVDLHGSATELSATAAAATLTVPVAAFVLAVWLLAVRPAATRAANTIIPLAGAGIGVSALLPLAEVSTAALLVVIVATLVITGRDGTQLSNERPSST